jgi:hypothetical protein
MFPYKGNAFTNSATPSDPEALKETGLEPAYRELVGFAEWAQSVKGLGFEPRKLVGAAEWALAGPRCSAVEMRLFYRQMGCHRPIPFIRLGDLYEITKGAASIAQAVVFVKYA